MRGPAYAASDVTIMGVTVLDSTLAGCILACVDANVPAGYRALVSQGDGERPYVRVDRLASAELPDHPVTVRVEASSLNYKDALAAAGRPGVMRRYPGTPGIDAAGTVLASRDERWRPGDAVIVTSFDLGMGTPGGFAELIRVPGDWPTAMPAPWAPADAMAFGTAGLTAALALLRLRAHGLDPAAGPVAVTGAAGGVGTCAVALLSQQGFEVIAVSGRSETEDERLRALGASQLWTRERLAEGADRPLRRADLAGAVDAVGGAPLAHLLARVRRDGVVAAAGTVAGTALATSVFPFVLRGVALLGIDSAEAAPGSRAAAWALLAESGVLTRLRQSLHDVDLDGVEPWLAALLESRVSGRVRVLLPPPGEAA